jgi:hypothetical protein
MPEEGPWAPLRSQNISENSILNAQFDMSSYSGGTQIINSKY